MPNPSVLTQRVSWNATAQEVSRRLGKTYSGQYVREVARGWRLNLRIQPVLIELGLMPKEAAERKPGKPGPKPKKDSNA